MEPKLSDKQLAAVMTGARRAVVVACPGSGKTEVIVQRVVHLIKNGCAPVDIAVVTYTNAAARVIERRVNEALAFVLITVKLGFVGTLHAFCLRHLGQFGHWRRAIRVIDEEEADERLLRVAAAAGCKVAKGELFRCRAAWLTERVQPETPARIAVRSYYREMTLLGELDHNSILLMAYWSLNDPEEPRRPWKHLIVDEFQDAALIDFLIYEATTAENRFVVGDPMQSIFAFRGGDPSQMLALAESPIWTRFELDENWRSLPAVCEALTNLAKAAGSGMVIKSGRSA